MDYRNLITVFLLLNICSFFNSEEVKQEYCIETIKSSSLLLKMKKDIPIALKCYQSQYGYWSFEGDNNGKIEDKKIGITSERDYLVTILYPLNHQFKKDIFGESLIQV